MKTLGLNEIRKLFLEFYESKQHFRRNSFSLVPENDKSLLIINSGMAPLKSYFAGLKVPPAKRMTTCQKCIRTADIENVGITSRHGTFFEMLGSFSFGDYFKEESITWGWEFLTKVLNLPEEKLWVTVYEEDDEAYDIWKNKIGFPEEKIVRLGKDDNFWEIGTGPCGPCSEIYFDRGEQYTCDNPDCKPGCDCDRYVEFWNHVFTQFNRTEDGRYEDLKYKNIDTGMGLERIACIMQETDSIFDVDTIKAVLDEVCHIANIEYKDGKEITDISIRVITDHIRSATFMIGDGIMPSNEGRGYVLRRLIRRAIRHGKKIGIADKFLNNLSSKVIETSKSAYPELETQEVFIKEILSQEEDRFFRTLNQGLTIIENYVEDLKSKGEKLLSGELAFKLHDTYGFPFEITKEILQEKGFDTNREDFDIYMNKQKTLGKEDSEKNDFGWKEDDKKQLLNVKTEFIGYDLLDAKAKVIDIIAEDDKKLILLDRTVFYPKGGGQNWDGGTIKNENSSFDVIETIKFNDAILHKIVDEKNTINIGDEVVLKVNESKRNNTSKNHTCTHLLHKALRTILGEHVKQAGSYIDDKILRFDFSHFKPLSKEEVLEIENYVNEVIDLFMPVTKKEMPLEDAKSIGAIGIFEDKYKDNVRVVSIGDVSKELCGGTHIDNSGQIGGFKILSESGISAGVRRIEAITGKALREYAKDKENILNSLSNLLKTSEDNIEHKVENLLLEVKEQKAILQKLNEDEFKKEAKTLIESAENVNDILVIKKSFTDMDIKSLKEFVDDIRSQKDNVLVLFTNSKEDKHSIIIGVSKELTTKGINAGNLVRELSKLAGGKGGGKPDLAQGSISNFDKIDDIYNELYKMI